MGWEDELFCSWQSFRRSFWHRTGSCNRRGPLFDRLLIRGKFRSSASHLRCCPSRLSLHHCLHGAIQNFRFGFTTPPQRFGWGFYLLFPRGLRFLDRLRTREGTATAGAAATHCISPIRPCDCAGLYGLVNSGRVRVRQVAVKLPNLPASWRGRVAALVTDTHLGHVRGVRFARRIVAMVSRLQPDIVLIGGDLYDGTAANVRKLAEPLREVFGTVRRVFHRWKSRGIWRPHQISRRGRRRVCAS